MSQPREMTTHIAVDGDTAYHYGWKDHPHTFCGKATGREIPVSPIHIRPALRCPECQETHRLARGSDMVQRVGHARSQRRR